MSSIDPVFRWPIRLSAALGYDELDSEQKSKDDISADLDYRDTFTEDFLTQVGTTSTENAAWTSYTPTFVNFTLGDGAINRARYRVTATSVLAQVAVTLGGTSAMGTNPTFGVPIAAASNGGAVGVAFIGDTGTRGIPCACVIAGSGSAVIIYHPDGPAGTITALLPMVWATGDTFQFTIEYERTT